MAETSIPASCISVKKVTAIPSLLQPDTIYLCEDTAEGLVMAVSDKAGAMIRKTKSHAEIQASLNSLKTEILAMIPQVWETVQVDHSETWGADTYIQQVFGSLWRIKKIDADGNLTYSTSSDPSNAGVSRTASWVSRTTLVYS